MSFDTPRFGGRAQSRRICLELRYAALSGAGPKQGGYGLSFDMPPFGVRAPITEDVACPSLLHLIGGRDPIKEDMI